MGKIDHTVLTEFIEDRLDVTRAAGKLDASAVAEIEAEALNLITGMLGISQGKYDPRKLQIVALESARIRLIEDLVGIETALRDLRADTAIG